MKQHDGISLARRIPGCGLGGFRFLRDALRLSVVFAALPLFLLSACSPVNVDGMLKTDSLPVLGEVDSPVLGEYKMSPGDTVEIKVFYASEFNDEARIRPDGYITLQLIGDIRAAGRTARDVAAEISKRYAQYVRNPETTLIVRSFPGYRVFIGGEVVSPQVIPLDGGLSAYQAIFAAGGNLHTGDMEKIILIRKGKDNLPQSFHLNLSPEAVAMGTRDTQVALQPSDIIFIPKTGIAVANQNVTQYVRDLLLFNGTSLGASFTYVEERK